MLPNFYILLLIPSERLIISIRVHLTVRINLRGTVINFEQNSRSASSKQRKGATNCVLGSRMGMKRLLWSSPYFGYLGIFGAAKRGTGKEASPSFLSPHWMPMKYKTEAFSSQMHFSLGTSSLLNVILIQSHCDLGGWLSSRVPSWNVERAGSHPQHYEDKCYHSWFT